MKKLLLLLAVVGCLYSKVNAQAVALISTTNNTALDTVTNTATRIQAGILNGYQDVVSVVATVTEISGTTGGAVTCWGSVDGVADSYVRVDANTFTPADQAGAQSYGWFIEPSKFPYYQVRYTGTGTMAAKLKSKILGRKK